MPPSTATTSTAMRILCPMGQLARLPTVVIGGLLRRTLPARFTRTPGNVPALTHAYRFITRLLAILILPVSGMAAVVHGPAAALLLAGRWPDAGMVFLLLAPAIALLAINGAGYMATTTLGRTDIERRTSTECAGIFLLTLATAAAFGPVAAAATYSLFTCVYQRRYLARVLPLLHVALRDYCEPYLVPLIGTGLGVAAYRFVLTSEVMADWMHLMLAAVIGFAVMLFSILLQRHTLMDEWHGWQTSD